MLVLYLLDPFEDALFAGITLQPLFLCGDVLPAVQKGFAVLILHVISLYRGGGRAWKTGQPEHPTVVILAFLDRQI